MLFISYSVVYMFLSMTEIHVNFIILSEGQACKSSITRNYLNVLEIFHVPLYTEFLSDLYKNFQAAYIYDTNVEYQI